MKLKNLLNVLENHQFHGDDSVEITGLSYDSRRVQPGHLFVALPGQKHHGLDFLEEVKRAGVAVILSDRPADASIPLIVVDSPRLSLAKLSNAFYGSPSSQLKLLGVTGTNGKTTTTFLLRSIFETAGQKCGLIGTIRYSGEQFSRQASMTTPESLDLQELFVEMLKEGSVACAMEVSSQGLVQYRAAACTFEAAVFSNLTHEHLDYHKTMEEYYNAKKMLFDEETCTTRLAVLNVDDPYGKRLFDFRKERALTAVSYGFGSACDFRVVDWSGGWSGTKIVISHGGRKSTLTTALIGEYNVYNVCSAFATAVALGLDPEQVANGIAAMKHVPGRMELLDFGQPFTVIVDYAHTDDAFRQLLPTLRRYTQNRLIHIFGCGGDRDRTKRPIMGKASGELSDIVVLTSDNPRSEDPLKIMEEVKAGIDESGNNNIHPFVDRAEAIAHAVEIALPGDTIVITGKGNETYQLIQGVKHSFDEKEYFREAIERSKSK